MTYEDRQEIIAIIKDTIKSELGSQKEVKVLQETLIKYIRQTEAKRPFLCSTVNCPNRKSCK